MKKYQKKEKYKKYNKRHSKKLFKRKQEYKKWKQGIFKKRNKKNRTGYFTVDIPGEFTLLSNTSVVLKKINEIRELLKNNKKTFINLKKVNKIDNGSITVLLSIMTEYKLKHIDFNGNFPTNDNARILLLASGFFEHLSRKVVNDKLFNESSKYVYGKKNQIVTKPGKEVYPDFAKEICESVSKTLKHKEVTSKGLYKILIELMHNTNNHANISDEGKELWWLTVHHDKTKSKVSFIFLDLGVGIFKSLQNKKLDSKWGLISKIVKDRQDSNNNILEKILKGEIHKTVTELPNRGKGLNGIYEVNKRKQIKNLYIITNDVFANIDKSEYKIIDCKFDGTFVYWEIDRESEVNKWVK